MAFGISGLNTTRAAQAYNLARFSAGLLIGVALAKSGMPADTIALYETLWFLTNLVSFFWVGGGYNALLATYHRTPPERQRDLVASSVWIFLLLGLLAALGMGYFARHTPHIHWAALFLALQSPGFLIPAIYLVREQPRPLFVWGSLGFLVQILAVCLPVWAGWGVRGAFIGLSLWAALRLVWVFYLAGWRGPSVALSRAYGLASVPLVLHLMIGNSSEYVDGFLVKTWIDSPGAFAVFRFGARELPLSTLLIGGLVAASVPLLARDQAAGLEQIKRKTLRLAHWLYPISMVLMAVSSWIFPLVYSPEFAPSAAVFNIYLLILSSRILLPQAVLLAGQKHYFLVASAITETIVNVGLSWQLVQSAGMQGIALGSVVAFLVNKAFMILVAYRLLGVPPAAYIPWKWLLFYNMLLFALYLWIQSS